MNNYLAFMVAFTIAMTSFTIMARAECPSVVENGVKVYKCERPSRKKVKKCGGVSRSGKSVSCGGTVTKWKGT